jgi:hypothetical protein
VCGKFAYVKIVINILGSFPLFDGLSLVGGLSRVSTRVDDINRLLAALNVCEAVLIQFQILSLVDIAPIFQLKWYVFLG